MTLKFWRNKNWRVPPEEQRVMLNLNLNWIAVSIVTDITEISPAKETVLDDAQKTKYISRKKKVNAC